MLNRCNHGKSLNKYYTNKCYTLLESVKDHNHDRKLPPHRSGFEVGKVACLR